MNIIGTPGLTKLNSHFPAHIRAVKIIWKIQVNLNSNENLCQNARRVEILLNSSRTALVQYFYILIYKPV